MALQPGTATSTKSCLLRKHKYENRQTFVSFMLPFILSHLCFFLRSTVYIPLTIKLFVAQEQDHVFRLVKLSKKRWVEIMLRVRKRNV
jgi:hypothetical protein